MCRTSLAPPHTSAVHMDPVPTALWGPQAEELGDAKLTPLKEALPPEVTWEDLRLVLAHRKGQAESPPAKRPARLLSAAAVLPYSLGRRNMAMGH